MKIVIFPNHGSIYIPPFLKEQLLEKSDVRNRIELVKLIMQLKPTHNKISQSTYNAFSSNTHNSAFKYLKGEDFPNIIYVKDLENRYGLTYMMEIVEVDTTKVWKIAEYDGAEGIKYFKEPRIIDKDLNLGEW